MKLKDIWMITENVRKLKVNKETETGGRILETIPVYSACVGEAVKYANYEVYKIDTELTYDNSIFFENEAKLKSIVVIYLMESKGE